MQPTPQPRFKDSEGRDWLLSLNIGVARRIRAEVGIDIGQLDDGKVFIELSANREKLAGVLWLLVEKQAAAKRVEPEQFAESLGGDALDGAMEALRRAIVLFSPSQQRKAVEALLAKTVEAQAKSAEAAVSWLEANAAAITESEISRQMEALPTFGSV